MTQAIFIIRVASSATPRVPVYLGDPLDFNRAVSGAISALAAGSMFPAGFIALNAPQSAPSGWLVCDGAAVARAQFPALFAAIGTLYGAGDGTTTFNLPTQAQCVAPAVAPTPPQVITGGSVQPATPPVTGTNPTSGTGANSVTGGRSPRGLNYQVP